jgi:hypothetical protein
MNATSEPQDNTHYIINNALQGTAQGLKYQSGAEGPFPRRIRAASVNPHPGAAQLSGMATGRPAPRSGKPPRASGLSIQPISFPHGRQPPDVPVPMDRRIRVVNGNHLAACIHDCSRFMSPEVPVVTVIAAIRNEKKVFHRET